MCIALSTSLPECIVEPEQNIRLKQTVEVDAVHCREVENRQMQIKLYMKFEHE